ncbi:MAG: hypothetical protein ACO1N0_14780 [Fluviicola sp.]
MKVFNLLIVVFIISSCSSNQSEIAADLTLVNEINEKVAFENRCKLGATFSDQTPDEIKLKIGNSYNNPFYPGKILFDYYNAAELTDLDLKEYHLSDTKEKLYSLSKDDFLHLTKKNELSKSLLTGFKSNDLTKFYNQFDTTVTNKFTLQGFNNQLLEFDFKDAKFSGFQIVDSILGMAYGNSKNQMVLIYKWNSKDNKIYGFSVE